MTRRLCPLAAGSDAVRHATSLLRAAAFVLAIAAPAQAQAEPLGRLFYTPEQRAQLESARTRKVTRVGAPAAAAAAPRPSAPAAPAARRYDGMVIRSDGKTTRWVDGRAETGPSSVTGLKPGQTRARGRVYEPYEILRPEPVEPHPEDIAP